MGVCLIEATYPIRGGPINDSASGLEPDRRMMIGDGTRSECVEAAAANAKQGCEDPEDFSVDADNTINVDAGGPEPQLLQSTKFSKNAGFLCGARNMYTTGLDTSNSFRKVALTSVTYFGHVLRSRSWKIEA